MPTELGTLDALHLATAVLWREWSDADLVMAAHDTAPGLAHALTDSGSFAFCPEPRCHIAMGGVRAGTLGTVANLRIA
jgi:hypothetical protein